MGRLTKIERLRREQSTAEWRNKVFKRKGKKCAVCETTENLEIHHVLPLVKGGDNDLHNLLVVCQKHHKQLHGKIHRKTTENGRPRIISYEDALPTLKKYFNCEIGKRECTELLGFSQNNHSAIYAFKKRYKAEFGLPYGWYNNIDLMVAMPKRVYKNERGKTEKGFFPDGR